jgi:hypothetical protein
MATRYDQKTKDEVVAYVQNYNEQKGRGGQSAAVKKWDLNPITIKSWLEKAGVDTPGRGGRKKRKTVRGAKAAAAVTEVKASGKARSGDKVSDALQRMIAIQGEIASLEREFEKLKGRL